MANYMYFPLIGSYYLAVETILSTSHSLTLPQLHLSTIYKVSATNIPLELTLIRAEGSIYAPALIYIDLSLALYIRIWNALPDDMILSNQYKLKLAGLMMSLSVFS